MRTQQKRTAVINMMTKFSLILSNRQLNIVTNHYMLVVENSFAIISRA